MSGLVSRFVPASTSALRIGILVCNSGGRRLGKDDQGIVAFVSVCHCRHRGDVLAPHEIDRTPPCCNASKNQSIPCRHGEIPQGCLRGRTTAGSETIPRQSGTSIAVAELHREKLWLPVCSLRRSAQRGTPRRNSGGSIGHRSTSLATRPPKGVKVESSLLSEFLSHRTS